MNSLFPSLPSADIKLKSSEVIVCSSIVIIDYFDKISLEIIAVEYIGSQKELDP